MVMSGLLHKHGDVVAIHGWPIDGVDPENEAGRRVHAYWARHQNNSEIVHRYSAPVDPLVGGIFLPSIVTLSTRETDPEKFISDRISDVPRPPVSYPGMPIYELRRRAFHGGKIVEEGAKVEWLGWPADHLMTPANQPAELVANYFSANRENPKLRLAPWCEYRRAVILPALPQNLRPGTVATRRW